MKYQSEDEVSRLLKTAYNLDRVFHMLVLTSYCHGLRVSEALRLTGRDVDHGYLNVTALKHGNKALEPLVINDNPVFSEAALVDHASKCEASARLFPVSRQSVDKKLKKICRLAGVPNGVAHMHALRHALGMTVWDETNDPNAVQGALRHKSQASSMVYIHASNAKKAYEAVAARVGGMK